MNIEHDQLIYPDEANNMDIFGHLEELRRRILVSLVYLIFFAILSFANGTYLIKIASIPAQNFIKKFVFITPQEVFISYVKVSFLSGIIFSFPFILNQIWKFISPAISYDNQKRLVLWLIFSFLCLIAGLCFSFFIALPMALEFLIGFGNGIAESNITIERYISFFTAFLLIGGVMFQIPIVIGLLTDMGLLKPDVLLKNRKYAIVIILVIAAIITPTQDITNLLIFSLPMVLLYEIGIVISSLINKKKYARRKK